MLVTTWPSVPDSLSSSGAAVDDGALGQRAERELDVGARRLADLDGDRLDDRGLEPVEGHRHAVDAGVERGDDVVAVVAGHDGAATLVAVSVTTTVARGMVAFEGSVTVPTMRPALNCAAAERREERGQQGEQRAGAPLGARLGRRGIRSSGSSLSVFG